MIFFLQSANTTITDVKISSAKLCKAVQAVQQAAQSTGLLLVQSQLLLRRKQHEGVRQLPLWRSGAASTVEG